jgi:hypothetical protein
MDMNTAAPRKFKLSLGSHDSYDLKRIAEELGLTESEVMRKGLQLMALYAQTRQEKSQLVVKNDEKDQELRIVM